MSANLNLGILNAIQGFNITGAPSGSESGFSVSNAGDVNNEGYDCNGTFRNKAQAGNFYKKKSNLFSSSLKNQIFGFNSASFYFYEVIYG